MSSDKEDLQDIFFCMDKRNGYIHLRLTPELITRARNDPDFALQLAREEIERTEWAEAAMTTNASVSSSELAPTATETAPSATETAPTAVESTTPKNEQEKTNSSRWSDKATMFLINKYGELKDRIVGALITKKAAFGKISAALRDEGYMFTPEQCHTKWDSLFRTYKERVRHVSGKNSTGNAPLKPWIFHEAMHDISKDRVEVQPVATASSSGVLTAAASEDSKSSESSSSDSPVPTKRSKLHEILAGAEEGRNRRHAERMELERLKLEIKRQAVEEMRKLNESSKDGHQ